MTERSPYEIDFDTIDPNEGEFVEVNDITDLFPGDTDFADAVQKLVAQRRVTHNILAAVRAAAGVTQEELAEAWGRVQANVSRLEHTDLAAVQLRSLVGYLDALGATVRLVVELNGSRVEFPLDGPALHRGLQRSA